MKKSYITPEGAKKLQEELNTLWKVERPKVTQAVADAAAMGDRSENAEYIYGKKRLRQIDSRVRWLKNRLNTLEIVDRAPKDQNTVFFGAFVKLKRPDGSTISYQIVGPDELDISKNMITLASPLGKALKGRKTGDSISIPLPNGKTTFTIIDIHYHS